MLVRIPHHNCEQSGALRICVPKLEFGNKEQRHQKIVMENRVRDEDDRKVLMNSFAFSFVPLLGESVQTLWYLLPLVIAVNLAYNASRYELRAKILQRALHHFLIIFVVFFGVFLLLFLLSYNL